VALGRHGGGLRLDGEAVAVRQIGEVFHLAEAERLPDALLAHETAGAATPIDEALIAQSLQRIPNHRARHLELCGEIVFGGQTLVHRIGAGLDSPLDAVEHCVR
jgi:hypothetical protein